MPEAVHANLLVNTAGLPHWPAVPTEMPAQGPNLPNQAAFLHGTAAYPDSEGDSSSRRLVGSTARRQGDQMIGIRTRWAGVILSRMSTIRVAGSR